MIQFKFGNANQPMPTRIARALLYTQAGLLALAALFIGLVGIVMSSPSAGSGVTFGSTTVSGTAAVALAIVYAAGAVALIVLGMELGKASPWSRYTIAGVEIALMVFFAVQTEWQGFASNIAGAVFNLAVTFGLCVAVLALVLVTPPKETPAKES